MQGLAIFWPCFGDWERWYGFDIPEIKVLMDFSCDHQVVDASV